MRIKTQSLIFVTLTLMLCSFLVPAAFGAELTGTVKFEGEVPKMQPLKLDADPECAAKNATPPLAESLVLGDANAMANVLIRVKSGVPQKEYPAPKEPVIVAQEGCVYKPHVVALMPGQPLKFLNQDGILHNVHALPKVNTEFNLGMPPTMKESEKTFSKAEDPFFVKCDVHPWMGAYVAVIPNPFFAVTGKDGKFSIKNLPAGTYELEAWHEKLKPQTVSVTVGEGDVKTSDFVFKRPGAA